MAQGSSKDRGALLVVLGFAFVLTFNGPSSSLWIVNEALGDYSSTATLLYRVGQSLSFVVLAAASRWIYPLHGRSSAVIGAALLCFGGALTVALVSIFGVTATSSLFAVLAASFLAGALSSVLYLAWIEIICRLRPSSVLLCFAGAYLLSGVMATFLAWGGANVVCLACACSLPLLCLPLYQKCVDNLNAEVFLGGENPSSNWSFPFRPVALMAIMAFANSFIRMNLPAGDQALSSVGAVVVGALLVAAAFWKGAVFDVRILLQVSVPLMTVAALGVMIDPVGLASLCTLLSNAAFVVFIVFISVTLCSMVFRYGVNPLWLLGFVFAARTASSWLVAGISGFWAPGLFTPAGSELAMALIIALMSVLYPVSYSARDVYSSWGVKLAQLSTEKERDAGSPEGLYAACMVASRTFDLTHREEEVLFYLSQGFTLSTIAEKLYLSLATVKTHAQHIYRKTGVHGKAELIELLRK
ncbi:LuxR family transcriptional regulator [Enterorhabdus sp. NM05_H27]|uniref:response regulator transcription factor n=1 Tax=Adlercreutzia muris TaxID=1796610 RepID=UPI001094CB76|nr:helix-turn-helix transcriptional regulator [Adlercreutzia muris]TGY75337.1 LuxR family transcriptional regulator [Enterorhabdus sp. NM05_H27]